MNNRFLDAALSAVATLCAIFGLALPCAALWSALSPALHGATIGYWQAVIALTLVFLLQFPVFVFWRFARR